MQSDYLTTEEQQVKKKKAKDKKFKKVKGDKKKKKRKNTRKTKEEEEKEETLLETLESTASHGTGVHRKKTKATLRRKRIARAGFIRSKNPRRTGRRRPGNDGATTKKNTTP